MATLTKEEAACNIYSLPVNQENKALSMNYLESTGLYLSEVSVEETIVEEETNDSDDSFEISVPCSKRSITELLHYILPPKPVPRITTSLFLSENDLFDLVKTYFSDDWVFNADKLNNLMGKDGSWGGTKQMKINGIRQRGRLYNIVKEDLRDFSWKDKCNINEFRSHVRSTQSEYYTIGYARKSKTNESKTAKQKSLSLQVFKLKSKNLCTHVYSSIDTNSDILIEDRDYTKKRITFEIKNSNGYCQDLLDFITVSSKKIRLVIISFSGLSTNPSDIRDFVRNQKNLKEIVVDVGYKVEIFTRHQLLKDDKFIDQFACRTSLEKRSLL